jgi:hypothetical protein
MVTNNISLEKRMLSLATNLKVARKIVAKIEKKNIRQKDLAELSGIGEDYWLVSRFERVGEGSLRNYFNLIQYFGKYGFTIDFFYNPLSILKNQALYLYLDNNSITGFHINVLIDNFIEDDNYIEEAKDIIIYVLPLSQKQ